MVQHFLSFINTHHLFQRQDRLLIGVSGGADSTALCELCQLAGFTFEIAHCNFQLRGEESERDEKFVRGLAEKYKVPLHLIRFETAAYAEKNKCSIQVAARELRYNWFDQLLAQMEPPAWLLTAHHANDNIETVLMNFFKGTGIQGLQGIPAKSGKIIRPLLFATKSEVLSLLAERRLTYVEDSSNESEKYTRNYFRNSLIPSIQKVFPEVEYNLLGNIERFHEVKILYQQSLKWNLAKLVEKKGNEAHIPVMKLQKAPAMRTLLFEITREYGFLPSQLDDIVSLLHSKNGKYVAAPAFRIIRNRAWLMIAPTASSAAQHILVEDGEKKTFFKEGILEFNKRGWDASGRIPADPSLAFLDSGQIEYPLLLRKWKQGDYFYPLGMKKKKKISRFLIDEKCSLPEKEKTWVIESNKKIVWIIGRRIDDRFKIKSTTKTVLEIRIKASGKADSAGHAVPGK